MPERHWIEELPQHAGKTVAVRGWVSTTRSSGKIAFVVVRDGTGFLQAVISKKDVSPDVWDAFGKLTQETSLEVTGVVRLDARAPGGGGVELQTADLKILGPSPEFQTRGSARESSGPRSAARRRPPPGPERRDAPRPSPRAK